MVNKEYESEDYAIALQRAIEHHCKGREIPQDVENVCPWHTKLLNNSINKDTMEDGMKDRIQIDGIWYVKEDTLLTTTETLFIKSVEAFYRENGDYLRLMFDMPSAKFNVGDELATYNLTKLRRLKK